MTREDLLGLVQASVANAPDWEAISRVLLARHSCRTFRSDPVPGATIEDILSVAQVSAKWCNAQAWQLIVTERNATVRFRDMLMALADDPKSGSHPDIDFRLRYEGDFALRRREAGGALYRSVGIAREDKAGAGRQMRENYRLFGAPHVAILTTEEDLGTYGAVDCGIYLANLTTLMQARGIASIAQGALPRFSPQIRAFFGIPENRKVLCGLSFGYADPQAPVNGFRTTRAATHAAVRWVKD